MSRCCLLSPIKKWLANRGTVSAEQVNVYGCLCACVRLRLRLRLRLRVCVCVCGCLRVCVSV